MSRHDEERQEQDETESSNGVLWLAAGAIAGVAAGMYLAQRFGGLSGLTARARELFGRIVAEGDDQEHDDIQPAPRSAHGSYEEEEAYAESYEEHAYDAEAADEDTDDGFEDEGVDDDEDLEDDEAFEGDAAVDDDLGAFVSADEELEERVLEVFTNDPILRERAVDIGAVNPATIELTGHVFTAAESEHAMTLARGVPGVVTVVNRLAIRSDEQGEQDDDAPPPPLYTTRETRWEGTDEGLRE
jgi:hypothetical protein